MSEFLPLYNRPQCLYDYTVVGSDKASIDTLVDDGGNGALALPPTFRVLEIWSLLRSDEATTISTALFRINNDSGGNYYREQITVVNATVTGANGPGDTSSFAACIGATGTANFFGVTRWTIPFYADAVAAKAVEASSANISSTAANSRFNVHGFVWNNTAAITRLAWSFGGTQKFKVGSRVVVLGR